MNERLNHKATSYLYRYVLDELALIAFSDGKGKISYANENYSKACGYSIKEIIGNSFAFLNSAHHSETFWENLWNTVNGGNTWKGEIRNKRKDGSLFWVDVFIIPVMGPDGGVETMLTVQFDITEKKEAEELLKIFIDESHRLSGKHFYDKIIADLCRLLHFEYGFIGEYFLEDQSISTHSFVRNGKVIENFNYSVANTPCELAINEKKPVQFPKEVQKVFPNDHHLFQINANSYIGFPLTNPQGEVIGLLGFLSIGPKPVAIINRSIQILEFFHHFLTQELQKCKSDSVMEHQRRVMEEMGKLSSVGTLAAFMGHEINNSLQVVLGNTTRLEKQLAKEHTDPEKIKKALDSIKRVVKNMSLIIKGIKSMAHGQDSSEKNQINLKESIIEAVAMAKLKNKHIGARIECPELDEINIRGNYVQMTQVLTNLLTNALDAIEELEEKWVKIEIEENEKDYTITVTDSGPGIPKDVAEKIFNEFFTTKPVGKGTGLGLSVVKKIIEEHRGMFTLEEGSRNTCFKIVLPKINTDTESAA